MSSGCETSRPENTASAVTVATAGPPIPRDGAEPGADRRAVSPGDPSSTLQEPVSSRPQRVGRGLELLERHAVGARRGRDERAASGLSSTKRSRVRVSPPVTPRERARRNVSATSCSARRGPLAPFALLRTSSTRAASGACRHRERPAGPRQRASTVLPPQRRWTPARPVPHACTRVYWVRARASASSQSPSGVRATSGVKRMCAWASERMSRSTRARGGALRRDPGRCHPGAVAEPPNGAGSGAAAIARRDAKKWLRAGRGYGTTTPQPEKGGPEWAR